ncbi:hypothetical protein EVAR_32309_1 [Eumeta japonica]|uniref:Chitin-binding type-2 domain-containing protein n=1 Tax=Eumeta variegata TaxID=151549 RepID=A0A4C1WER7_EUMVA|nr:hypothetical protein EVAR_32309_1 [Eumeta japonica]
MLFATTVSSTTARPSRRPFRVASRRRTSTTSTTTPEPTTVAGEFLQDLDENESVEDPESKPRVVTSTDKTPKTTRRKPTLLKDQNDQKDQDDQKDQNYQKYQDDQKDQNPSATNEEENKRQSKKFSASVKQNQLETMLRNAVSSREEEEAPIAEDPQVSDFSDDISAETAIAIAAHQLLTAPPPSTIDYDEENNRKTTRPYSTARDDVDLTDIARTERVTKKRPTSTPISIVEFSSTTTYKKPEYTTDYEAPQYTQTQAQTVSEYTEPVVQTNSAGYTGVSSPQLGPSTARYLGTSEKYLTIPVDEFSYSTDAYAGGLSREPSYFTREYLLESPITKSYDDEYQYLSPPTTPPTTRKPPKRTFHRKISTTLRPSTQPYVIATSTTSTTTKPRRVTTKKTVQTTKQPARTYRPIDNYDYYDETEEKVVDKYLEGTKVVVHATGTFVEHNIPLTIHGCARVSSLAALPIWTYMGGDFKWLKIPVSLLRNSGYISINVSSIECLDIGNFPHPTSCKKFISCARMESGDIIGWEYICPKGLSFDPVGGICNWSAGLGCDEK